MTVYGTDYHYSKPEWREIRSRVLKHDCYTCRWCGYIGKEKISYGTGARSLIAHHVDERKKGGKDELSNLITLCSLCHNRIPGQHK